MNSVNLIGRLTRDPELRKTSTGKSVTNFCLAVNRANEDADFIDCTAWKETADLAVKYLHKGSQIGITGRLQTRTYDDRSGQRRKVVEVVIERMQFLSEAKKKEEYTYPYQEPPQAYKQTSQPYTNGDNLGYSDGIVLQGDDLPF